MKPGTLHQSFGRVFAACLAAFGATQLALAVGSGTFKPGGDFIAPLGREVFDVSGPLRPWLESRGWLPLQGTLLARDGQRYFLGYGGSFVRELHGQAWHHPGQVRRLADHIAAKERWFRARGIAYRFLVALDKGRVQPAQVPGGAPAGPGPRPRFIEQLQAELAARGSRALCYPLDALRRAPGRVFRLEDHHYNHGGSSLDADLLLAELGLPGPYPHRRAQALAELPSDPPEMAARAAPELRAVPPPAGTRVRPLRLALAGDSFADSYLGPLLAFSVTPVKLFSASLFNTSQELIRPEQARAWGAQAVVDERYEPLLPWVGVPAVEGFDPAAQPEPDAAFEASLLGPDAPVGHTWDLARGDLGFGFGSMPTDPLSRPGRAIQSGPAAEVYLRDRSLGRRWLRVHGHNARGGRVPDLELSVEGRPLETRVRPLPGDRFMAEARLPAGLRPDGLRRAGIRLRGWPARPSPVIEGVSLED